MYVDWAPELIVFRAILSTEESQLEAQQFAEELAANARFSVEVCRSYSAYLRRFRRATADARLLVDRELELDTFVIESQETLKYMDEKVARWMRPLVEEAGAIAQATRPMRIALYYARRREDEVSET